MALEQQDEGAAAASVIRVPEIEIFGLFQKFKGSVLSWCMSQVGAELDQVLDSVVQARPRLAPLRVWFKQSFSLRTGMCLGLTEACSPHQQPTEVGNKGAGDPTSIIQHQLALFDAFTDVERKRRAIDHAILSCRS